jgi:hypothetical protein
VQWQGGASDHLGMRGIFMPLGVTLAVLLGGQALLLVLVVLVAVRKFRRDRSERSCLGRRAKVAAALHGDDDHRLAVIVRDCKRSKLMLTDLIYVLDRGEELAPERVVALRRAAHRTGLVADLQLQLTSRRVIVRGRAVLALAALSARGCESLIARMLDDRDADVRLVGSFRS